MGPKRRFDKALAVEAVRLVVEDELSARQVERDLGLSQGTVARWKWELAGCRLPPGAIHVAEDRQIAVPWLPTASGSFPARIRLRH